jgi:hypothetical protein
LLIDFSPPDITHYNKNINYGDDDVDVDDDFIGTFSGYTLTNTHASDY